MVRLVDWGVHPTPFGECLVATTSRGVCALRFGADLEELREEWPRAQFRQERARTESLAFAIFGHGERPPLHVFGTNFQLKVWEALLRVPDGAVTTYGDIAAAIGDPKASRAVGTAVGSNPVSYIIPCHRVIRSTGELGGYAWGPDRKRVMLALETTPGEAGVPAGATPPGRMPATPPAARRASASGARPARSA